MIFQMISAELEATEFPGIAEVLATGVKQSGVSKSFETAPAGAAVPRPMLWNQPKFEGFAGPMYGKSYETGEECLRYEAWKAYDILSR